MVKTGTLYDISDDLTALEELLIESGGELPDATAEAAIDSWLDELGARRDAKVDSYCALIRNLESRAAGRRAEAARLMDRARIDGNAVDRLKGRLLAFSIGMRSEPLKPPGSALQRPQMAGFAP